MTRLRAKPTVLEAHRLRYGDVHGLSGDLPEWLEEAVANAVVTLADTGASVKNQADPEPEWVPLGSWLVLHPTGRVSYLSDQEIALDYEVLP